MFFASFESYFDARIGRPSIPMETYLRLMFLKFRYRLGYESLCREVGDSISWQRFCRIPFGTRVPHPTTLMKITTKCGDAAVTGLNEALLAKAAQAKLLRTDKVRADTTVVEAEIAYPTDSGLLAKAVGKIARTVERIKAAGGATRTRAQDRRRAAGRRARSIAGKLKLRGAQQRDEAQASVQRITGELAGLAEAAMREAAAVVRNAKRALRRATGQRKGQLRRAINELDTIIERATRVVAQTRSRLAGVMPESASRLVSLPDTDARPIRKGRLGNEDLIPLDADFVETFHGYEYRLGLVQESLEGHPGGYRALSGEYVGEQGWSWDDRGIPLAELSFREAANRSGDWPWPEFLKAEDIEEALITHRDVLKHYRSNLHLVQVRLDRCLEHSLCPEQIVRGQALDVT